MVSMVIDFHTLFLFFLRISASSAEFVGRFWFRESSQVVIQGNFHGVEGAKAVGSSGNHSDFVVEALNGAIDPQLRAAPRPHRVRRLPLWLSNRPLTTSVSWASPDANLQGAGAGSGQIGRASCRER